MSQNTENTTPVETVESVEVVEIATETQPQVEDRVEEVSHEESTGSASNPGATTEDEDFDETTIACIDDLPRVPWENLDQFIATLISDALKDGYEEVCIRGAKPLPRCVRDKLENKGFNVEEDYIEPEDERDEDDEEKSNHGDDEESEEEELEDPYWLITISWGEYDDENELFWEQDVEEDDEYLD